MQSAAQAALQSPKTSLNFHSLMTWTLPPDQSVTVVYCHPRKMQDQERAFKVSQSGWLLERGCQAIADSTHPVPEHG